MLCTVGSSTVSTAWARRLYQAPHGPSSVSCLHVCILMLESICFYKICPYIHSFRPELIKPATSLYLHNLTGTLETAVRATNAQFESTDILNRLDVRMLDLSPGDQGWDVFSLHYHVTGPISTVSGGFQNR